MSPQEFETLVSWLRQDLKRLDGKVDAILAQRHPSPCPFLQEHIKTTAWLGIGLRSLLFDLLKTSVVAFVVTLLILWKTH